MLKQKVSQNGVPTEWVVGGGEGGTPYRHETQETCDWCRRGKGNGAERKRGSGKHGVPTRPPAELGGVTRLGGRNVRGKGC